jgi:hypothetical protein
VSLRINTNEVWEVLLADGWHEVGLMEDGTSSFEIDAYEFYEGRKEPDIVLRGGEEPLVSAAGFTFDEKGGDTISGPLASVLAVRHAPKKRRRPITRKTTS